MIPKEKFNVKNPGTTSLLTTGPEADLNLSPDSSDIPVAGTIQWLNLTVMLIHLILMNKPSDKNCQSSLFFF